MALRDAHGRAIAAGDSITATAIRKVMAEQGKKKVPWSRKRRRKEAEGRRRRNQRHEPAAGWEAAARLEKWIWKHRDDGGLTRLTWPG
jgi:hypothetical protein